MTRQIPKMINTQRLSPLDIYMLSHLEFVYTSETKFQFSFLTGLTVRPSTRVLVPEAVGT